MKLPAATTKVSLVSSKGWGAVFQVQVQRPGFLTVNYYTRDRAQALAIAAKQK